jgi:Tat protein secretion system quality control protein TatD with DNase activity
MEEQASVFKRQLTIAKELDLPVCLHIRGEWELMKRANNVMKVRKDNFSQTCVKRPYSNPQNGGRC